MPPRRGPAGLAKHIEAQVVADYEAVRRDGSYFYTVRDIIERNRISNWTLHKITLRHGLARYETNGAPSENARLRKIQAGRTKVVVRRVEPYTVDVHGERVSAPPDRTYYRCACGGRSTDPAGHPSCAVAA